mgnify:CR=1 FL=1
MARVESLREQEEKQKPKGRPQSETTALWWGRYKKD